MSWENTPQEIPHREPTGKEFGNPVGKVVWPNAPMTNTPIPKRPSEPAAEELSLLAALATAGLPTAELATLPAGRQGRLGLLLPRARSEPAAALSVLGILSPELRSMWRRLVLRGVAPADAEADVVGIAWEVVAGHRRRLRRPTAGQLANAIWTEVRREAGLRRLRLEELPWPEHLELAETEADHLERWPGILAAAVAHGYLSPRQVVVVAETRMEGRTMAEVARRVGRPVGALYKERQRAEESLRTFALSYDWTAP
jgi:DNA-directed RNA polymerase specialized sigma24 family protein